MLDVTRVLTTYVAERIDDNHAAIFGSSNRGRNAIAKSAVSTALARISSSDALYHNVEHTAHVVLVGLQVLLGKHAVKDKFDERLWLNMIIALACHDIGYVRGICQDDKGNSLSIGSGSKKTIVAKGSSDAALMPLHVNRGKQFVCEHFSALESTDISFIKDCIERTRFPVPNEPWYLQTGDYPGLVRGADLVGQLSDRRYLHKLAAVFCEFEETGFNASTGYNNPGDLLRSYPQFFEQSVAPFIGDTLIALEATEDGREIIAFLYGNLDDARRSAVAPSVVSIG